MRVRRPRGDSGGEKMEGWMVARGAAVPTRLALGPMAKSSKATPSGG